VCPYGPYISRDFGHFCVSGGPSDRSILCVVGLDLSFATQIHFSRPRSETASTFDKPSDHT